MQQLNFKNRNNLSISATLHKTNNKKTNIYAIFAHCFTCGKNINAAKNIANHLAQNGINILRFDFTGIGESEGDISDAYFTSNILDLVDAADFLKQNYHSPSLLIGHSLGGTAALAAALQLPDIKAVATIGAPADSGHILTTMGADQSIIDKHGQHVVEFYGNKLTINQQFVDDVCEKHLSNRLSKMRKALLIMHSPIDQIVSIDNAGKLFEMAQHPKSFISLNKADHLLSKKHDAQYAANIITKWAAQYLNLPIPTIFPKPVVDSVIASLDIGDKYQTRISMGKHQLISDEPKSIGGSDYGATPTQLLAASLASCTNITLSMYATRKGFDVKSINCTVTSQKVEGQHQFNRAINITGNLTNKEQERMLAIANKCPIHKLLTKGSIVNSYLT